MDRVQPFSGLEALPAAIGWFEKATINDMVSEEARANLAEIYLLEGGDIQNADTKTLNLRRDLHQNASLFQQHEAAYYLGLM